jgi:RNA polymerase sigma-70 factor (ECF subfamily)
MFAREAGNAAAALPPLGLALPPAAAPRAPISAELPAGMPANPPDLRSLTLAIRRGDAEAFSHFYNLYSFRLYKFLLVLAHGDELEAGEVCQAVLIKLATRLKVFDEERQLWAWLCALARTSFIDHYRARQRRNRLVPLDDLPAEAGMQPPAEQRLSELLREALAGLEAEERELLQAAYIDEQPLQSLADQSGQTYKAVECRLARLRLKLKQHLLKRLRHEPEP